MANTNKANASAKVKKENILKKPATQFWVLILLLIVIVFLLNAVMSLISRRTNTSIDLTANAVFKIDDATKDYLAALGTDVDIFVLASEDDFLSDSYLIQAQRIMEQYPRLSPHVNLQYIDYMSDPTFASRFPDIPLEQGNLIVTANGRVKRIRLSDLFNYTLADSGNFVIASSRAEEAITSAIINVVSEDTVKIAVIQGNGTTEAPGLVQVLTDNNYITQDVALTTMEIDPECDFALLLAPQSDFTENELEKLDAFLYNSGSYGKTLFYTADVSQPELPNLESFLREWGISVEDGVVFETDSARTLQNQPYYPIVNYTDTSYKNMLTDPSSPMLAPLARPLTVLFASRDNFTTTVLTEFSETSGVRPSNASDDFRASEAEVWGPLPAMVMSSKRIVKDGQTQYQSNIIVSASTALITESHFYSTSLTNSEYLLNIFNNISQRTNVVNIRPKSLAGHALTLNSKQAVTIGVTLFVVLPLAILAAGIGIWVKRRYQ